MAKYFGISLAGKFLAAMKFYFPDSGYDLISEIDWTLLKGYIEAHDIRAVRLVSNQVKAADQYGEVDSTLTTLGDTMLKINQMNGGPGDSEKDQKQAKRKEDIRNDFKEGIQKWYQEIVGNYCQDGEL